jgi:hypothetical protein
MHAILATQYTHSEVSALLASLDSIAKWKYIPKKATKEVRA